MDDKKKKSTRIIEIAIEALVDLIVGVIVLIIDKYLI